MTKKTAREPARERFVRTAARMFAERGYAATSIADIQTELGLRAGSGALYKHFQSKRALLDAVVDVHLTTMREGNDGFVAELPEDVEPALHYIADAVWRSMRRDRDVLRVLLRDLDDFPELRDRLWRAIRRDVYDAFTAWLQVQHEAGTMTVADPKATGAVLLGSLTYAPILDALIGHRPGDIGAARYRNAWVAAALTALRADEN